MAENAMITQTKNFFGKLSTWQKALLIGLPIILIAALGLVISSSVQKDYGILYSNLEQADAGKIIESLKAKNIDYELGDNGTSILVDKTNLYDTRISLAAEGLPESSVVGYELFDKANLGMSEFVQKLNYRRALEGELSKTIASLDEIQKVRVHIVIPEKALFKKDEKQPTASISVHLKSGRSLSKISIDGIQNMVASSVEGMSTKNVSITDQRGNILNEQNLDEHSIAGLTAQQLEQQRNVEEHLAGKVQSMLDGVLGVDNSKVKVNVDLDFTQVEQTKTDYDPEKQIVRSEQQISDQNKSSDSLSYPAVNMDKKSTNVIQNYEIAQNIEHIIHSVGNVKRLSVATMINGTHKIVDSNGVKKAVYIPRTNEEMNKLTEIVRNAVGFDPSRNDQISVLNVPFDNSFDYSQLEKLNPKVWYKDPDIVKLIIMIAIMLLAIMIMFRLLQSKQIKNRMRIAMELPKDIEVEDEKEEDVAVEEELEELDLGEDLLLLPAELPEQLLLEGEREEESYDEDMGLLTGEGHFSEEDLADRARASLEDSSSPELTEDALMRIEIKNKVTAFCDTETEEAIKIIRALFAQDIDEKISRF